MFVRTFTFFPVESVTERTIGFRFLFPQTPMEIQVKNTVEGKDLIYFMNIPGSTF